MKRIFDILFSAVVLLILLPLFAVIAIILKFSGEGEVIFFQDRIGQYKKKFKIIKFVTMRKDSETSGSKDITTSGDPRVLPIGKILRSTKINELPQFFNVLFGDMSIVGPRPMTPRLFDMFPEIYKETYMTIKPGLTGLGSIAFRDEESLMQKSVIKDFDQFYKEKIIPEKTRLEVWYRDHLTFALDIKLVLITVLAILFSKKNWVKIMLKEFDSESTKA